MSSHFQEVELPERMAFPHGIARSAVALERLHVVNLIGRRLTVQCAAAGPLAWPGHRDREHGHHSPRLTMSMTTQRTVVSMSMHPRMKTAPWLDRDRGLRCAWLPRAQLSAPPQLFMLILSEDMELYDCEHD